MNVGNYTVKWSYFEDEVVQRVGKEETPRKREVTECAIILNKGDKKIPIHSETIARMWTDAPNKELARKISMGKTLAFSKLSKEERTLFWETYRTQTKNPRWAPVG